MKITHYLYNTFVVESSDKKIVIDPGALFFYFFRFTSLLPETEWESITHVLVTHGDPDHYWHTDRVADASGACSGAWTEDACDKPCFTSVHCVLLGRVKHTSATVFRRFQR